MAGFEIKQGKLVKGSSLIEVVVALIIIMIVFSIATGIYANILKLSLSLNQYRAETTLAELLKTAERSPLINEEAFSYEGYHIKKHIRAYSNNSELIEIHLMAFNSNKDRLAELRKVVYVPR